MQAGLGRPEPPKTAPKPTDQNTTQQTKPEPEKTLVSYHDFQNVEKRKKILFLVSIDILYCFQGGGGRLDAPPGDPEALSRENPFREAFLGGDYTICLFFSCLLKIIKTLKNELKKKCSITEGFLSVTVEAWQCLKAFEKDHE